MIRAATANLAAHKNSRQRQPARKAPAWGTPEQWKNAWEASNPGQSFAAATAGPPQTFAVQTPNVQTATERMPWDVQFEGDAASIKARRDQGYQQLDNEENQLGLDYGIQFDRTVDPNTGLSQTGNYRIADNVDVTNPYSRAALLKKSWTQAKTGNTNSMAAAGQLYSGALGRAQRTSDDQYQGGTDSLLKGFGSAARGIFQQRYGMWGGAEDAIREAEASRLERALAAPAAPAAAPAPTTAAQALAQLGGTLVVTGKKRGIRYPDGHIEWM